jgi:hypothetical protein
MMKVISKTIWCILLMIPTHFIWAQAVSINTDGSVANASSILDIKSTTKGVLVPRMTKAEKNGIVNPAIGLLVYQNAPDSVGFHYFDGIKWLMIVNSNTADTSKWKLLGTAMANKNTGNVGIGTGNNVPTSTLQVEGTIAIGTSMNIVGGAAIAPVSLVNFKSYIGLSPVSGNDYYELPDPSTCVGRIYYIRNNNNPGSNYAYIRSAGTGLICEGAGPCLGVGTYKAITTGNPNPSPKTVMCISDGINWTVTNMD